MRAFQGTMVASVQGGGGGLASVGGSGSGTSPILTALYPVDVRQYGALFDGVTDDTVAIAAAIAAAKAAGGGTVTLPAGVCVANIEVPGGSTKVHLKGAGVDSCTIISALANRPVIRHAQAEAASNGITVSGFTVKARATNGVGSGPAIDLCGFRASNFDDIGYSDNGTGYYESFFSLSSFRTGNAAPACYGNVIRRPYVQGQPAGPKTVFLFDNGGTANAVNNANANVIEEPWIYANPGITRIVDALRSALTRVRGGLFEENAAAIAVRLGTKTIVQEVWIETNLGDIEYSAGTGDGASNSSAVRDNYFSNNTAITIPAGCDSNVWEDNGEPSPKTFTDSGSNNVIRSGSTTDTPNLNGRIRHKNRNAGGADWSWEAGATGGNFPGSYSLIDILNNAYRLIVGRLSAFSFLAGSTGSAAIRAVPKDDVTPGQAVIEVTNAGQGAIFAHIAKSGDYYRNGIKVVGAQGAAVLDAAGGATVDAEARAALNALLARLRAHGLIA